MDKERYRADIQLSVQERVRKDLLDPKLDKKEKLSLLEVIRPEQREFFIKTLPENIQIILK